MSPVTFGGLVSFRFGIQPGYCTLDNLGSGIATGPKTISPALAASSSAEPADIARPEMPLPPAVNRGEVIVNILSITPVTNAVSRYRAVPRHAGLYVPHGLEQDGTKQVGREWG
ncbi:MAG TPA: hypothetical protein VHW44_06245 [Pseudonocardiaceae bacterium]|jgi:hypothetical protein|nr:hypothetical protein [Pseudonocardiaceae bacterium]